MKRVWSAIFTLVIVGLVVFLLKDINFYEVYLLLTEANLVWFFLAVIATAATFLVWNIRSVYILKTYLKVDFWFYMKVLLAGSFFNTVTPGAGIGGEPFRAHFLSQKYKKPRSKILGYVLGDSFFRIAALSIFILFSVFFVLVYVKISNTLTYILEGILIFVLVAAAILLYLILKKSHFRVGALFGKLHRFRFFRDRFETADALVVYVNRKIRNLETVFRNVVKNKNNLIWGIVLSFLFWILNFLTAYFLFLSFGFKIDFLSVIIVFTLGNILGSISPVPGGVGVVEGSMVLLYSAMGIFRPLALLVSLFQRLIYYFFSLFVGGWCLISLRKLNGKTKNGFF